MPNKLPPNLAIAVIRLPSSEWLPPDLARIPLSLQQQAACFNVKRQQQFLSGRWLLAELLFNQLGYARLPEIEITDNGRPAFISNDANGLIDFNISHSGEYIMVALAQGCRIGLDVEHIHPRKNLLKLAQYSFSPEEYQWLLSLPSSQQNDGFWQLWTLRESVLKLSAKGVWQMKQLRINPQQRHVSADFLPQLFCFTSRQDDRAWAVASDYNIDQPKIWLVDSESKLVAGESANLIRFMG
ncbi:MAG: 4'-phosphopantetheinyl transferase superfamily protein [Enterobacteriaceae bacterium]|jgi:4'-phosphopantetheinyl transferase|nr:4'-phosphopantetheinyl transferase superfamily protein [Enterobacteriaceae bacterium]